MPRRLLPLLALLLPAAAHAQGPAIGVNASVNANQYNATYSLADVLKAAGEWRPEGWRDPVFPKTANGGLLLKPGEVATIRVHYGAPDYPLGDYTVEWEGDGDLTAQDMTPLVGKGKATYRVSSVGPYGIELRCTRSDPANPLRLKAIWAPGYADGKRIFRDEYVAGLKGYGLLRFVDDLAINLDTPGTWAARPKLSDERWNRGLPVEALVELCSRVGADCWYELPHLADDDYARQAAKLLHAGLPPPRRVFVEVSNEVWNWGFSQAQWQKDKFAPGTDPNAADANFYGQTEWLSWRSVEAFKAFEAEWGKDRASLVTVIAGQHVWPERSRYLLARAKKFRGGAKPCDALAIAPYFAGPRKYTDANDQLKLPLPKVDDLLAEVASEIRARVLPAVLAQKAIADEFGAALVAYEGGPHLTPEVPGTADFVVAANRHPRMEAICADYLAMWAGAGGKEFAWYGEQGPFNGWAWGLKEGPYATLDESPKLRGVRLAQAALKLPQVAPVPRPDPPPPPKPIEVPRPAYERDVDEGSDGYSERGAWLPWSGGRNGTHRYHQGSDPSPATASYAFDKLVPGEYQLLAAWTPAPHHASKARYAVKLGGKEVAAFAADQRPWAPGPGGFVALGSFAVPAGQATATVELAGNADGDVVADEVRLVCTKADTTTPDPKPDPKPDPGPGPVEPPKPTVEELLAAAKAEAADLKAKADAAAKEHAAKVAGLEASLAAAAKARAEAEKAGSAAVARAVEAEKTIDAVRKLLKIK